MRHNQKISTSDSASSAGTAAAVQLNFWRTTAIAALLLAGVLAVTIWVVRHPRSPKAIPDSTTKPTRVDTGASLPGNVPWGTLTKEPIIMERPDRLFTDVDVYFEAGLPWVFDPTPFEAIEKLVKTAGLNPVARDWLLDRKNWQTDSGGILIVPPNELLMELSPAARSTIYGFLAQIPGNRFKNDPFKIPTRFASDWFTDSGVSPATERLIRGLTYQRGPMLCFSDLGLLADRIPVEERRAVLRALSRMPAVRAFLQIEHGDDLSLLTSYWSAGGRIPSMLPLLDSLRHSAYGGRIDLSYLLPRFCRERLYTFPDPAAPPDSGAVDCFWTVLNFFRYPPEQPFIDVASRMRYLKDNYEVVTGEPSLGDIMAFYDSNEAPVHACVYIAGDLVFTKNGATNFSPWVLMTYRDMLDHYSMDGAPTLRILRARKRATS